MFTRKSGQNWFGTATCTSLPGEISQSVWECFDDLGLDKNCNDTALKCVSLTRLRRSIRLELRLLSSGSWAASPSSPQKNSRYQPVQKTKKSGAERAPTTELRLGEDWRKKGSPLCGNAGLKSCDLRFLFVNDFDVVFSRVGVNYWITYD